MSVYTVTKILNPGKGYPCVFRNWRAQSHCKFWHGYDLIFELTLTCNKDNRDASGWVYDFGNFSLLKDEIEHNFDHKWIIAEDDPLLQWTKEYGQKSKAAENQCMDLVVMPETGCEAFACWLARSAADMLYINGRLGPVQVLEARVFETMANSAGYRP